MVGPLTDAVALRGESLGVWLEETPRRIQDNTESGNGYSVSLNPDWLSQLDADEQGTATLHSLSVAQKPVIVQNPAIIIQPAAVLED